MKKLFFIAAAALAMTACSDDNVSDIDSGEPVAAIVRANISGVQSRAVDTEWENGDMIGITCTGGKTAYSNVPYTVSDISTGSFQSNTPIYFQDSGDVTFSAYYPYNDYNAEDGFIEATAKASAQKSIDFMFATGAKASKNNPLVRFTNDGSTDARFKHCMSKLNFDIKAGDDVDLTKMSEVTILGFMVKGYFYPETGVARGYDNAMTEFIVRVAPTSSTDYSRSFIFFPQQVNGGNFTLLITLDGVLYSAYLTLPNASTALEAGKSYSYTITVRKTAISVESSTIEDWTDGGSSSGTAEMY